MVHVGGIVNTAQRLFVVTSWLFISLAGLLFLVPTDFPSAQGAAWACLGVGIASHLALLAALVFDQIPGPADNPPAEG
jgi:hypothetical protein